MFDVSGTKRTVAILHALCSMPKSGCASLQNRMHKDVAMIMVNHGDDDGDTNTLERNGSRLTSRHVPKPHVLPDRSQIKRRGAPLRPHPIRNPKP